MPRFHLQFERTATVKETGGVSIEVTDAKSVADVYKAAFAKDFKEFLISDREYEDEEWEFSLMKDPDRDEIA